MLYSSTSIPPLTPPTAPSRLAVPRPPLPSSSSAGSRGWGNYRHQADVYHAYQMLKRGGLSDSRIVVMHYDDIARNPANPHPGKIINIPGGGATAVHLSLVYSFRL